MSDPRQSATARGARPEASPAVVQVLLSERLADARTGLDLPALSAWLETHVPAVRVQVAPDLTRRFDELPRYVAASAARRIVLAVETDDYGQAALQASVRRAGLDPLGVAVRNLAVHAASAHPRSRALARCALVIAAAVARVRAFPGSRPEHLRMAISVAMSRRALFTLAVHEYHTAPAIRGDRCAADRGCHQCADVCPRGALRLKGQRMELDRERCVSCALCTTACPADAIEFPGDSAIEQEAEVAALLDPRRGEIGSRGILFVCRQSEAALAAAVERGFSYPAGWLPVSVPCAGALSPALLLRSLARGATTVGILGCRDQCAHGQGATVAERVAFCQGLLEQLGAAPDRVRFCPIPAGDPSAWTLYDEGLPGAPVEGMPVLGAVRASIPATAAALLALGRAPDAKARVRLDHPRAPFGIAEIDTAGCTACGVCADTCPTGALECARGEGTTAISFDPALCHGCNLCSPRCPETDRGVLRIRRSVDLEHLASGRTILKRDESPRCERCGAPVAPAAMMARLAKLLGEDYAALSPVLTRLCSDCRGLGAGRD